MKRIYSIILSFILMTTSIVPAYGMSILDAGAGAGAGGVDTVRQTTGLSESQKSSGESNPTTAVGCKVPTSSARNSSGVINEGVYAGSINLSGLSETEAMTAVNNYITKLGDTQVTLDCVSGNKVTVPVSSMGLYWKNTDVIDDALSLGQSGNVIKRFKELADLKRTNKVYPVELGVDTTQVKNIIASECVKYDVKAQDALMKRSSGSFNVTPGHDGMSVDVDSSVDKVAATISEGISGEPMEIELVIEVTKPRGDTETLSKLTDVLGTFTTRFYSSGKDRVTNVANGCRLVNGTLLYPGEQISVSQTISPMTEENGYALAGSYLNGQVVESFGGGICQVSTTLYQAVLRAELQVDERHNHSMVVNYVDHSGDAAIAEGVKDFKFTNNLDNPIYIDGYTTPDKTITFTIYGVETRPSNRTLEFESVDLEEMEPEGEKVVADSTMAAGTTKKQSAHIGYKSEFYKIVKVDGVEKERTKVNSSYYQAVPATLTVGTQTDDPTVKQALKDAIATQDIEYCLSVASGQTAPAQSEELSPEVLAALALAAQSAGSEQTVEENPPD